MRLELQLSQRPEMQLRLSPQLIQRIEILQLPAQELIELIQQESSENEILEVEPARSELTPPQNGQEKEGGEPELSEQVSADLEGYTGYSEFLRPKARRDDERDPKMEAMKNAPSAPSTLADHLLSQVSFANLSREVRAFIEILIQHLDENGFLADPLEEILIPYDEGFTIEVARDALDFLRTLDPVGVGATDMRECFLMQLDREHPRYKLHKKIVSNHLDDWRDNRLPKMARAAGVDLDQIKEAMEDLRSVLMPPPGRLFREDLVVPVRPDVVVTKIEGQYVVSLEDGLYPQISVSSAYLDLYRNRGVVGQRRRELKGKIDRARFLMEAIEQRKNTLRRVAEEIVQHQVEFLEHGRLLPLKMRDVADSLGLHVSTVSRAISDKWMQTARGIFSLKHFFTGAASGGEAAGLESRDSVRTRVQEIIEGEDKRRPLSDEEVVKRLRTLGLDIARRTVTKYRKMLDIPSSRQRREY
ncbi:MAG: RNA polymerase factor sigma-54 [Planctomycetota bacterium]